MTVKKSRSSRGIIDKAAALGAGLALSGLLTACNATVGEAVSNAAQSFGQSLFAASSTNYDDNYTNQLQALLFAMAYKELGLEPAGRQQRYPNQGYGSYGYPDPQGGYKDPYYSQQQAGDPQDPYAGQQQGPYYSQQQAGYPQDPYYGQQQGGYQQDPYASQQQGGNQIPYGYRSRSADPIRMDVAILAQTRKPDGTYGLEPIEDGAVLRDGRGDPKAGDKIKVSFTGNCDCFIYIIGIDATGYIVRIFPEDNQPFGLRVRPNTQYTMPQGDVWWGLDEYRGVEQIYFIASKRRRLDIEQIMIQLAGQPRELGSDYVAVTDPVGIPVPRGLVKVVDAPEPMQVTSTAGETYSIAPTAFEATVADADVVISRWFRHE